MAEEHHPYWPNKVIRIGSRASFEAVQAAGSALAAQLDDGDVTPLPDGVHAWLTEHTSAANSLAIGLARRIVADTVQPPYDADRAKRVAQAVRRVVEVSNRLVVEFEAVQILAIAELDARLGVEPDD